MYKSYLYLEEIIMICHMLVQTRILTYAALLGTLSLMLTLKLIRSTFASPNTECDPSYPDVCISPPPPDLDCGDIPHNNIRVVGSDPHGFDREGDGVGCES
ncbi:MAG: hypothetical protein ACRD8Z_15515 [Nitrososphaeraceae archaeon]